MSRIAGPGDHEPAERGPCARGSASLDRWSCQHGRTSDLPLWGARAGDHEAAWAILIGRWFGARGATRARPRQPWTPEISTYQMSVLAPAVGAVIAAIVESSVLTHLQVGGLRPDLVFAVGIAVAMVLGFESGMTWAFVGGISLDLLLPGRSLGSTALTLVLVTAAALLVARATWPPRLVVIAGTTFVLAIVYQVLLLTILALTEELAFLGLSPADLAFVGLLDAVIATVAAILVRAVDLRFGEPERLAW
jgi:rod shape-determining protein MreD